MRDPGSRGRRGRARDPRRAGAEPRLHDLHRFVTLVLSAAMAVVGVTLVVATLAAGGGPLARGTIFGVLLALAGAGRLHLTRRGR